MAEPRYTTDRPVGTSGIIDKSTGRLLTNRSIVELLNRAEVTAEALGFSIDPEEWPAAQTETGTELKTGEPCFHDPSTQAPPFTGQSGRRRAQERTSIIGTPVERIVEYVKRYPGVRTRTIMEDLDLTRQKFKDAIKGNEHLFRTVRLAERGRPNEWYPAEAEG